MTLDERLERGATELGLALSAPARSRLLDYLRLLQKWNHVYSLTAVREPAAMVDQHVLDSLAALPHLAARRLLDVGSGAGLPGIPLAVVRPDMHVTLLDANQKKAAFLRQAVIELALPNAAVVCERVEAWRPDAVFDVVVSRAFSDLGDFVAAAGALCARGGRLAAMKGVYPREEMKRLPPGYRVASIIDLDVPNMRAERHLVLVEAQ
jgi:16S rRNA (guanine527-N7)-methyltransferase